MTPGKRKAPDGTGADAKAADQTRESYTSHETYMDSLARRIRWLEKPGRRHWWLRTEAGRPQLEFIERRDAA